MKCSVCKQELVEAYTFVGLDGKMRPGYTHESPEALDICDAKFAEQCEQEHLA